MHTTPSPRLRSMPELRTLRSMPRQEAPMSMPSRESAANYPVHRKRWKKTIPQQGIEILHCSSCRGSTLPHRRSNIRTGDGEKTGNGPDGIVGNISSYTLPDGSKVWLNKNSWLAYNQKFGKRTRQVALKGEGYFEVNRDERRPFIVKMQNNLDIKVLGTTFNACNYPSLNKAEVILRSGSVQVSDNGRNEYVILKPNQKFTWNEGTAEISSVNAMNCCRWFEHRLVFDNVKLKDILENLSHKYQTEISLNVGNLADKHMSMTIRDESVEDILDILTTLLPIRWRYQGAEIIIENKTKNINNERNL